MTLDGNDFLNRLAFQIGRDSILQDREQIAPFLIDSRGEIQGNCRFALAPSSVEQLSLIMQFCYAENIPMVPQGGNSGRVGGATPDQSGNSVLILLHRLNQIGEIDKVNRTLLAEAGAILAKIQAKARQADFDFPLSLGAEGTCQIGGNIATNAGGIHVIKYGNCRDLVLGLEVILPDGRIWNGLHHLPKDNTGYDLKHLFIGSEGTLGICR